jgi:hypothetical protein
MTLVNSFSFPSLLTTVDKSNLHLFLSVSRKCQDLSTTLIR